MNSQQFPYLFHYWCIFECFRFVFFFFLFGIVSNATLSIPYNMSPIIPAEGHIHSLGQTPTDGMLGCLVTHYQIKLETSVLPKYLYQFTPPSPTSLFHILDNIWYHLAFKFANAVSVTTYFIVVFICFPWLQYSGVSFHSFMNYLCFLWKHWFMSFAHLSVELSFTDL